MPFLRFGLKLMNEDNTEFVVFEKNAEVPL